MSKIHGGQRRLWAVRYGFGEEELLDLSTGINPNGWVVPAVPTEVWQRLPEDDGELLKVAASYYATDQLLPIAGSQAAIQAIPQLRTDSRVGMLPLCYSEHARGWRSAGHKVVAIASEEIDAAVAELDVLVIINPNNPTGERFSTAELLSWHQQLAERGGWLIVDEAFIDATPEHSLCAIGEARTGLIVLRSLGKFFGLAGVRAGFIFATESLRARVEEKLGPWAFSHPAQWVTKQVLADKDWQAQMYKQLPLASKRLSNILTAANLNSAGSALFQWCELDEAVELAERLLQERVLVRVFNATAKYRSSLRFGLPASESEWLHLESALKKCRV